jgi:hypothetical protein
MAKEIQTLHKTDNHTFCLLFLGKGNKLFAQPMCIQESDSNCQKKLCMQIGSLVLFPKLWYIICMFLHTQIVYVYLCACVSFARDPEIVYIFG